MRLASASASGPHAHHSTFGHALPHDGKRYGLRAGLWHYKVRFFVERGIDLSGSCKLRDFDGLLAGKPQVLQLFGFDDGIFTLLVLVAFDNVGSLYGVLRRLLLALVPGRRC